MSQRAYDIGIFDSGIGGLTIAHSLFVRYPHARILYYADSIHAPYGVQSPESIVRFSLDAIKYFDALRIPRVLIACNTAAIYLNQSLKEQFSHIEYYDVLDPLVQGMDTHRHYFHCSIFSTAATKKSQYFQYALEKIHRSCSIYAPQQLVHMIETLPYDELIAGLCEVLPKKHEVMATDVIALACTHFPLIQSQISAIYDHAIPIVNAIDYTCAHVGHLFSERNLENGYIDLIINNYEDTDYLKRIYSFLPTIEIRQYSFLHPSIININ